MSVKESFLIGWESVRANARPSLILWAAALTTVAVYFAVPGVESALSVLGRWQCAHETLGAIANRIVFCGLVPGLCMLAFPSIRPARALRTLAAETLWCAAWAIVCGAFYRLQAACFGDGNDVLTLLEKTLVDQFVWTVFLIAPTNAVFYFWVGKGFSLRKTIQEWPRNWFHRIYLPNLLANWCVWIPVVASIYAFPLSLQLQVGGFIGSFWILICLEIGRRSGRPRP